MPGTSKGSRSEGSGATASRPGRVIIGLALELAGLAIIFATYAPVTYIGMVIVAAGLYPIILSGPNARRHIVLYSLILVIAMGFNGLRQMMRYQQLEEQPATGRAMVLDTGTTYWKGEGKRWISYSYTVDGTTYTSRDNSLHYLPGDSIPIRYAIPSPDVSIPLEPELGK